MTTTTKLGDTWDLISYRELGSCRFTDALINANRQFVDVLIFRAGIELVVPNVETQRKSKLPPWRTDSL